MVRRKLLMLSLACGLSLGCFLALATAPFGANEWGAFMFRLHLQWLLNIELLLAIRIAATLAAAARRGALAEARKAPAVAAVVLVATLAVLLAEFRITFFWLTKFRTAAIVVFTVALFLLTFDGDPASINPAAPRSRRRVLGRFAVGLGALLALGAVAVGPAFLLRARLDSQMVERVAKMYETRAHTYEWEYYSAISTLEKCSGPDWDPGALGAEMSPLRMQLYQLGFREFRESEVSREALLKALVGSLERSSGQHFGGDVAAWRAWLKQAAPAMPPHPDNQWLPDRRVVSGT